MDRQVIELNAPKQASKPKRTQKAVPKTGTRPKAAATKTKAARSTSR